MEEQILFQFVEVIQTVGFIPKYCWKQRGGDAITLFPDQLVSIGDIATIFHPVMAVMLFTDPRILQRDKLRALLPSIKRTHDRVGDADILFGIELIKNVINDGEPRIKEMLDLYTKLNERFEPDLMNKNNPIHWIVAGMINLLTTIMFDERIPNSTFYVLLMVYFAMASGIKIIDGSIPYLEDDEFGLQVKDICAVFPATLI